MCPLTIVTGIIVIVITIIVITICALS